MPMSWPFVSVLGPAPGQWKYRNPQSVSLTLQKPFSTRRHTGGGIEELSPADVGATGWETMLVAYQLSAVDDTRRYAFRVPRPGRIAIGRKQSSWLMFYFPWNLTQWAVPAASGNPRHHGNALVLRWAGLEEDVNRDKVVKYILALNTSRRNRMPLIREEGDSVEVCYLFPNGVQPPCADNLRRRNDGVLTGLTPDNVAELSDGSSLLDLAVEGAVLRVRDLPFPVTSDDVIPFQGLVSPPLELDIGFAYIRVDGLRIITDQPWTWVDVDKLFDLLGVDGRIGRGGLGTWPKLIAWYERPEPLGGRIYRMSSPPLGTTPGSAFSLYNPPEPENRDAPDMGEVVPVDVLALSDYTDFSFASAGTYPSYKWTLRQFAKTGAGLAAIDPESVHNEPGLRPTEADTTIIPQLRPTPAGTAGPTYILITGAGDTGDDRVLDPHSVIMQNIAPSRIDRVWGWTGGRAPLNNVTQWVQNRVDLGITDIVISLNDHAFTSGLGLLPRYYHNGSWSRLCDIFAHFRGEGVAPHVMVFLRPQPVEIEEAAGQLQAVSDECGPLRSIQLDLEGWWTRRPRDERVRGEAAIRNYFFKQWVGERPELGIGITCIADIPDALLGALSIVDFAVPQMYASVRNYGHNLSTVGLPRALRHYRKAERALGPGRPVYVGQTANPGNPVYITAARMRSMLDVVLQLGPVHEVAFWSDLFLDEQSQRRALVQEICANAKGGGLTRANLSRISI